MKKEQEDADDDPMNIEYYQDQAEDLMEQNRERDKANRIYDDMDHNDWDLPVGVRGLPWIRKVINTDPADAISAAVRVLGSLTPRITYQPLAGNVATRKKAAEIERNLSWQLASANRRRQGSIEKDIIRSAAKYDEVCAQVIDLDYQIAQKKMIGSSTKREKAMRRYGRFAVIVHHPSTVHVAYSAFGPEAVVLARVMTTAQVQQEWGAGVDFTDWDPDYCEEVTLYDYTDYDYRAVWVESNILPKSTYGKPGGKVKKVIMQPTKHKLKFLPWVCRVGGDQLEAKAEHRRRPLLYQIRTSGSWDTSNIIDSLMISEVIAHSASPRLKEEGSNPESAEIDYGDPSRTIKAPAGNVVVPIPPPPLDRALAEVGDRIKSSMGKATVSRILMDADMPSGTSFASLNLATQTAIGALKPAKLLAEQALADVMTQMLLWMDQTGKALEAYGAGKVDMGQQYLVTPDDIDPESIYITVELTPDIPTDKQSRANTAAMLVQAGLYARESAMTDIGVNDPLEEQKRIYFEMLSKAKIDQVIATEQALQQFQIQQMYQQAAQQQQMAAEQAKMAMQQQAQPPMPQMGMGGATPGGIPGAQGPQWNPAMGGLPAQTMMPEATREGQTGMDMMGNPMLGGGM